MPDLDIQTARVFEPLLYPSRYKGAYGGRGSGKSVFFAELLIERCVMAKTDAVCVREVQATLKQSVKKLLEEVIDRLGVGSLFEIQHDKIKGSNGSLIIFTGMANHTAESIKSLQGFDIAWFEEAQSMSQRSLDLLRPTIRKDDSELWFSWNPRHDDDPIDVFFRHPTKPRPDGAIVVRANYTDNPWCPQVLIEESEFDRKNFPEKFEHVWLGEYEKADGEAFFKEPALLQDGFPVPYPEFTDQIFAVVDTALKDGLEHDGTAVVYCAKNKIDGNPLVILDWEVLQISGDLLFGWLPTVNDRLESLSRQTNARQGNVGIWIEDKASGIVLIQQSQRAGMNVYAIDSELTNQGKDGRSLAISGYVYRDMVKISDYAYNKVMVYRDTSKNHFLSQVCGYRLGAKTAHGMDLLDCFTYSVAIGLGDSTGY